MTEVRGQNGKRRRCRERPTGGEYCDHNQIGEGGRREIDARVEGQQGCQCEFNAAEEKLRCQVLEIRGLAAHHSQNVPGLANGRIRALWTRTFNLVQLNLRLMVSRVGRV